MSTTFQMNYNDFMCYQICDNNNYYENLLCNMPNSNLICSNCQMLDSNRICRQDAFNGQYYCQYSDSLSILQLQFYIIQKILQYQHHSILILFFIILPLIWSILNLIIHLILILITIPIKSQIQWFLLKVSSYIKIYLFMIKFK